MLAISRGPTSAMLVGIAALVVFGPAAGADEAVLKVQTALPKTHDLSVSFISSFVEKINVAGKGVVRVEYLGGPEINPPDKAASAVERGAIDMLHTPAAYHAGQVPQGASLMATNLDVDEYRKNGAFAALEPNWEKKLNSKIIAIGETSAQFYLYLTKKPELRPDGVIDVKGWKIRTTGAYRPLVEALGATPVQITNAGEVYTALERGVVEGLAWPEGGVAVHGWQRYIKYRVYPGFFRSTTMATMNKDKFESLSNKAREQILAAGLHYENRSGEILKKKADTDNGKLKAAGMEDYHLQGDYAKAYLRTIYDAKWADAEKRKYTVPFETLKSKMFKAGT